MENHSKKYIEIEDGIKINVGGFTFNYCKDIRGKIKKVKARKTWTCKSCFKKINKGYFYFRINDIPICLSCLLDLGVILKNNMFDSIFEICKKIHNEIRDYLKENSISIEYRQIELIDEDFYAKKSTTF